MIELDLCIFGGRGGGSGGGDGSGGGSSQKSQSSKLGDEISSRRGIRKDYEYLVSSNSGERMIRTGEQLLKQIKNKTLNYDEEIYHWIGSKGSYTIRRIIRRKK